MPHSPAAQSELDESAPPRRSPPRRHVDACCTARCCACADGRGRPGQGTAEKQGGGSSGRVSRAGLPSDCALRCAYGRDISCTRLGRPRGHGAWARAVAGGTAWAGGGGGKGSSALHTRARPRPRTSAGLVRRRSAGIMLQARSRLTQVPLSELSALGGSTNEVWCLFPCSPREHHGTTNHTTSALQICREKSTSATHGTVVMVRGSEASAVLFSICVKVDLWHGDMPAAGRRCHVRARYGERA